MATILSDQLTALAAKTMQYPIEASGKVRFLHATVLTSGTSTTPNTYELFDLPAGRVRLLPAFSRIITSAWGASRVLDIGHNAYLGEQNAAVALDDDAFTPGGAIDISSAVDQLWDTSLMTFDMFSMKGVRVTATVSGADQPDAATLEFGALCIVE